MITQKRIHERSFVRVIAEIAVLVLAVLSFTAHLRDMSPAQRIRGSEYSYLVNSAAVASVIYHKSGALSLWNPFIGRGEPLFENPFSFILNPLMSLPFFMLGAVQGGKIAVTLHALIMALGGWTLAYVLRLRWTGRLLLGALLGGSPGMIALIGDGFFQFSLSQAYIPWVYAGLLGALYDDKRWQVGVLAVSAALLLFSGTYWFALPTAIGAAVLTVFGLVNVDVRTRRAEFNTRGVRRLLLALTLTLGTAAVRWLPQFVHHDMVDHPLNLLTVRYSFLQVAQLYFKPVALNTPLPNPGIYYHYIMPMGFAMLLALTRPWMLLTRAPGRWRILLPGVVIILLFTVVAQEDTPFLFRAFQLFPVLMEWRFLGRAMALSTLWIAVIAAMWFDDLCIFVGRQVVHSIGALNQPGVSLRTILRGWGIGLLVAAVSVSGVLSALDILSNWRRYSGLWDAANKERELLTYLRSVRSEDMLPVETSGFYVYLPFYDLLVRATVGNPDYRPRGLPSTIGTATTVDYPPEYAINVDNYYIDAWHALGYEELEGAPRLYEQETLLVNPLYPTYAFLASADITRRSDTTPLQRYLTIPVSTYTHHIDTIHVRLDDYPAYETLLVVTETAYPGWTVSIDGRSAPLESVGGLLGVILPPRQSDTTVSVVFSYQPLWLYLGGFITLLSAPLCVGYLLRLDRRILARNLDALRITSRKLA